MQAAASGIRIRYVLLWAFTILGILFIIAPLFVVVVNSFSAVAYNVFPPEGFSLRWYQNLAGQAAFYAGAWRSLVLATLATLGALIIGTMAGYALVRYRLPMPNVVKAFMLSPIVMPKIVLGVALFMFFVRIGTLGGYSSLLFTHMLVVLPFVISLITAALFNFDWTLQEAAMDLGAGPLETFFRVILPEISVSVVVAGVFAFVTSFDQVETTLFLVRPGDNTLPVEMFLYLQKWQDPTIAALSTVLILFAVAIIGGLSLVLRNQKLPLDVGGSRKETTA
ncbi:Spermidine Putrescine ABC transporter permease component potC (TC_3.A.1.11.1) [Hyphomicrobiales bacterium]|nr:Spermidine Putrescine ABC transporter permease component potC (TC_3.A.1.11.1) [Hyphomicrobiales bacterium]CAH1694958.1 Spermidine Putrescine ABC transporter permease component potC (TC_3.A.1.11.1) [Hyphomicrobiales bacterium]